MDKLIERCEQATGSDERLSLIEACEESLIAQGYDADSNDAMEIVDRFEKLIDAEAYLDAAMTLVPEGLRADHYYLSLEQVWHEQEGWEARFDTPGDECGNGDTIFARAATPALALCAAALRARSSILLSDK